MKLSAKRRQAIYGAVYEQITQLRIAIRRRNGILTHDELDMMIARAGDRAADDAVKAAEGERAKIKEIA